MIWIDPSATVPGVKKVPKRSRSQASQRDKDYYMSGNVTRPQRFSPENVHNAIESQSILDSDSEK